MSSDLKKFHQLLAALIQDGSDNLRQKIQEMPIIKAAQWMTATDVKKIVQDGAGDFGEKIISINPPRCLQDSTIGLWCKWDFESSFKSKVEVMICRGNDQNCHVKSYGFRIDPPHFQGPRQHDYWHAQSIRDFQRATAIKFPAARKLDWLNDSVPAYPIIFSNAEDISITDTTIYAALSIYGSELPPSIKTVTKSLGLNKNFRHILAKVTGNPQVV